MTLAAAAPAAATPAAGKCQVQHGLDLQPVAAVIAYAEAPDNEACGVGTISLWGWRNDVVVSSQSGWRALNFRYDCVTTTPTRWRTSWDREQTFNCG